MRIWVAAGAVALAAVSFLDDRVDLPALLVPNACRCCGTLVAVGLVIGKWISRRDLEMPIPLATGDHSVRGVDDQSL